MHPFHKIALLTRPGCIYMILIATWSVNHPYSYVNCSFLPHDPQAVFQWWAES